MKQINEGDIVLCTVDRIVGTTVFVKIEDNGEGTIITSEIAPGRIRNLRDYVVPNKKIVCKVLRIKEGRIDLSLRRVSTKEKNELIEKYNKEKDSISIMKTILKEKANEAIEKIKKQQTIFEFLQNARENPELLKEYFNKQETEQISKILEKRKEKEIEVKKEILLKSNKPDGIKIIKNILSPCKGKCEVVYLAAGRYLIEIKAKNYKEANSTISSTLIQIEKLAKENHTEFSIKEK